MARGNAIIAELFRLSDYIPAAFRAGAANKYTEVLFNFSYLSNQAYYENAIMAKAELQALAGVALQAVLVGSALQAGGRGGTRGR